MTLHEWEDHPGTHSFWERQGQTVLVTGAYSHLGYRVVERLNNSGWIVRVMVPNLEGHRLQFPKRVVEVQGNLANPASLDEALHNCDRVLHLEELAMGRDTESFRAENVEHTRNLVHACKKARVAQFILVSTAKIGYRIHSNYSRSKKTAEDVLRGSGLQWTIVRPTLVVGVDGSLEYRWLRRVVKRSRIIVLPENGHVVKRPVHEDDLADGLDLLLRASPQRVAFKTYHMAGRKSMTISELVDLIAGEYQLPERIVFGIPVWLSRWLAKVMNRILPKSPFDFNDALRAFLEDSDPDIEAAVQDLGYRPRPLPGRLLRVPEHQAEIHVEKHVPAKAMPHVYKKSGSTLSRRTR